MPKRHPELRTPAWLREQYEQQVRSIAEIAVLLECRQSTIIRAMRRHEIGARTPAESRAQRGTARKRRFPLLSDGEWLREQYVVKQQGLEKIALLVGCGAATVLRALQRASIPRRPSGGRAGQREYSRIPQLHDPVWLEEQYLQHRRTTTEIGAQIGCTASTVASMLSRHQIHQRPPLPRDPDRIPLEQRVRYRQGYRYRWRPDHPNTMGSGWMAEHRLIAEASLGRLLTRAEVVHHVNQKRDDNRIENLLVFPHHRLHTAFHENPPEWVPRCEYCGHPCPERLTGRPAHVPLLFEG